MLDLVINHVGDEKVILKISGRLNTDTAPEVEAVVENLDDSVNELYFDLSECEYVSSAGLRIFMATQKHMIASGKKFVLYKPKHVVVEVLEMVGMIDFMNIEQ